MARQLGVAADAFGERLAAIRARLFDARFKRASPSRDEKVIVSWNGLAISALARAAIVLGDARYADAAVRAAGVILHSGHELPHVLIAGVPKGRAFADDRTLFASALLDVFELTSDATAAGARSALPAARMTPVTVCLLMHSTQPHIKLTKRQKLGALKQPSNVHKHASRL